MKIVLTRESFIKQFPAFRLPIIQEFEQEERIIIEGESADQEHPLLKKYPNFYEIFTAKESSILKEMYGKKLAPVKDFNHIFSDPKDKFMYSTNLANCLSVHIKNIRTKIKKSKLPIMVETRRRHGYYLIEK